MNTDLKKKKCRKAGIAILLMRLSFHSFYLTVPSLLSFMVAVVRPLNHVQLFVTPWTVAHQAPLPMGFPRQEHWSGLLFPSPGYLPDPGIEPAAPVSPALQAYSFTH